MKLLCLIILYCSIEVFSCCGEPSLLKNPCDEFKGYDTLVRGIPVWKRLIVEKPYYIGSVKHVGIDQTIARFNVSEVFYSKGDLTAGKQIRVRYSNPNGLDNDFDMNIGTEYALALQHNHKLKVYVPQTSCDYITTQWDVARPERKQVWISCGKEMTLTQPLNEMDEIDDVIDENDDIDDDMFDDKPSSYIIEPFSSLCLLLIGSTSCCFCFYKRRVYSRCKRILARQRKQDLSRAPLLIDGKKNHEVV